MQGITMATDGIFPLVALGAHSVRNKKAGVFVHRDKELAALQRSLGYDWTPGGRKRKWGLAMTGVFDRTCRCLSRSGVTRPAIYLSRTSGFVACTKGNPVCSLSLSFVLYVVGLLGPYQGCVLAAVSDYVYGSYISCSIVLHLLPDGLLLCLPLA